MPCKRYTPDAGSPQGTNGTCQQRVCRWFHETPRTIQLAQVGTGFWFVLGFLGPLFMPVFAPIGNAPGYWAVMAAVLALLLFLVPFLLTFTGPATAETWGVRQRIMLWQAAAGGAFLAIDWDDTQDDVRNTLGFIALMWVFSGAMGMWLEPAKSRGKNASSD